MEWSARGHPGGNETDGQTGEFSRRKGRVWKDKDMRRTISGQARWPRAAGKGCRETQPPGTMSFRWSWTVNRGFTEEWGRRRHTGRREKGRQGQSRLQHGHLRPVHNWVCPLQTGCRVAGTLGKSRAEVPAHHSFLCLCGPSAPRAPSGSHRDLLMARRELPPTWLLSLSLTHPPANWWSSSCAHAKP